MVMPRSRDQIQLGTWYANVEASRRIVAAQLVVWFAGAGPVVALAYLFAELALGHPAERGRLVVTPVQIAGGALWVAACAACGRLIGERRVAGFWLGVALFVGIIAVSVAQQRVVWIGIAYALVGLALLARARLDMRAGGQAPAP